MCLGAELAKDQATRPELWNQSRNCPEMYVTKVTRASLKSVELVSNESESPLQGAYIPCL